MWCGENHGEIRGEIIGSGFQLMESSMMSVVKSLVYIFWLSHEQSMLFCVPTIASISTLHVSLDNCVSKWLFYKAFAGQKDPRTQYCCGT